MIYVYVAIAFLGMVGIVYLAFRQEAREKKARREIIEWAKEEKSIFDRKNL